VLKIIYDASGNLVTQIEAIVSIPKIIGNPVSRTVEPGENISFSVVVSDANGVTYQWKLNGANIDRETSHRSGEKGDSLLLTNVSAADVGQYSVVVTNSAGSVTSAPAALLLDSDHNGLPDSWEIEKFGSLSTTQHSEGDPDHDGVSNIDEFFDGTDPTSKTSLRPRLAAYHDAGGSVTIKPMKLNYVVGESVTLTAKPITPNVFVGWSGDLTGTTNPSTIVLDKNKTIRARFASVVPLPTGLVSWWRAENDAKDVMGINPAISSPGIKYSMGEVGQAFSFDGTSEIKILRSSSLNVGTGDGFTIEAWIKPKGVDKPQPLFEWNDGSKFGPHLWIGPHYFGLSGPGSFFVNIVDNTTPVVRDKAYHYFASQDDLLRVDYWQHVALTYDKTSGVSRLFLNGVQIESANLGIFTPLTTGDLYLGHRPSDALYSGLMDEPTIYYRALTMNEIFGIYSAGFFGKDFARPYFTTPSPLPELSLSVGTSYTKQLKTTFGTAPVIFSLSTNSMPPGMTLSSAGLISGTPFAKGIFDFTIRATDKAGLYSEQLYVLRVY